MFPRRSRLSRDAFSRVIAAGKRRSSAHFSAVSAPDIRGVAVVVSKKTARLSVTRHRVKRRVMAALRTISLPSSVIVFPKASALDLSAAEMTEELSSLLSQFK